MLTTTCVHHRLAGRFIPVICLAGLGLAGSLMAGCGGEPSSAKQTTTSATPAKPHDDHGHAHSAEGPHHGQLVELGNDEYHAEVVHDDEAGTVTIYLLDGSAKNSVPIEATDVIVNVSLEGKAEQFKLPATPDTNDPAGKSSKFVSQDKVLCEKLDAHGVSAKLVVTVDGKPFSGKLAHSHDHGHDHEGGDHSHSK
ncbi:hypothetical protein Plim_0668 [Planctopirus limnophila DSM 3776]|uniref:Uncharacterized protein n=1 Tax=Planctopirus limnophila (strain ATCC 43296 / DSM 3776 / IFAM 1008 / Mu 290) TaxID=521674 RepID=D5SR47_PLAL2|nr:hypothetical protein [Planctopirus limnophila]ADG66515.1 hypothetical protein Plim_0668 [Planctopirus limnophila DSM 3776]